MVSPSTGEYAAGPDGVAAPGEVDGRRVGDRGASVKLRGRYRRLARRFLWSPVEVVIVAPLIMLVVGLLLLLLVTALLVGVHLALAVGGWKALVLLTAPVG